MASISHAPSTDSAKSPRLSELPSHHDDDLEARPGGGWANVFGGPGVTVGPRIEHISEHMVSKDAAGNESADAIRTQQREAEDGCAIQYRTCSWQKVRPEGLRQICLY